MGRRFENRLQKSAMFKQALYLDTMGAIQLTSLSRVSFIEKAYMAGGTALALQIGHRYSVDLDFFTQEEFDEEEVVREMSKNKGFVLEKKSWRTILGTFNNTKFSLFYYKYPLLTKTLKFEGINLASKSDIAAMKINAIEGRGTRRDFVDLFFLAKDFSFEEMFEFYDKKYSSLSEHLYSIIRGINYFADAEADERPLKMLMEVSWDEVKKFFKKESLRLAKEKFGV